MQNSVTNVSEIENLKLNNTTTNATFQQQLNNLPEEILSQPRFFQLYGMDKGDTPTGWSNPKNQVLYRKIQQGYLAGFDTTGHGIATDYLFLDFDHVLDDDGNWINDDAKKCFEWICKNFQSYRERSISGHGVHILAVPTKGKFEMYSGGKRGTLYFEGDNPEIKLEIFYKTRARYCLLTGNLYQCEPNAPIAHGEAVDYVFQGLLHTIAARAKKSPKSTQEPKSKVETKQPLIDSADYDFFRANIMLDTIDPSDHATLPDNDWFAVISAAKNIGIPYSDVNSWCKRDPERYNAEENLKRWNSATDPSFDIENLHGIAKRFGYSEKDTRREWYRLHPEAAPMNDDQREKIFWTQDKVKSCPVNLRLPSGFSFDQSGITKILPPKKETEPPKHIRACRAPIVPTKKFREPTKGTLEYGLAIFSDDQWRNIEVSAATIGDIRELSKILNLHGGLVDEPKIVSQFINAVIALNHDMPRIRAYNKTGWTNDDCTEFIYPHANAPYILRRTGFNYDKIFKPKGDPELWKQKFVEACKQGGAVATAYFGVALSSVIAKPILGFNPSAHLFGKSGGGKTALQKFIASTFGNPRELVGTFAATPKNRLLTADALCGLPNFYDELETVQGKKAEEQLANDAYNFYDGKGNQANKRDGTARETFKFDSARLTSGERPYLKQHDLRGAFKRILPLETRRIFDPYFTENNKAGFLPDELAADLHFFAESNFGHFGKIWTDYVANHKAEIKTQYEHFAKSYTPLKTYEPTHLKILAGAFVSVEFFAVATGIKSEFDKVEVQRNLRCIVDTLPTNAELDDTARALDFLRDFFAGHEKYFARETVNKPEFNNEYTQTAFECYGKSFRNGEVAFLRNDLTTILEEKGKFASAEKLINEFYDKGYLRHANNTKTFSTFFNGKTRSMIRFVAGVISTAEQKDDAEEDAG